MPRINTFILAVQDPETVENGRHSPGAGCRAKTVDHRLPIIQWHAGKRPDAGASCSAVDAIPAVHKKSFTSLAGRAKGPCLSSFWVLARGGIKGINRRQTAGATKYRSGRWDLIVTIRRFSRKKVIFVQNGWPAVIKSRACSHVVFGGDEQVRVVIGIKGEGDPDLPQVAQTNDGASLLLGHA